MESDLTNKAVLVTGASGGIGRAVSLAFAAEGARLALHCYYNRQSAEVLAEELRVPTTIVQADLRDEQQVENLFGEITQTYSRLDAIVVNAGVWSDGHTPVHEMSLAQWHDTIETDLTSAFLTCRAFMRHLAGVPRESASIVLVGSTAALFGEEGHTDYAAAKAGMVYGMTRSLKNEIVRLTPGGRVNCVCPGWTDTPMAGEHAKDPVAVRRVTTTMSLRKIAAPQDVANAVVFLTSDRLAGHLSGTILPIAGGMEGRPLHLQPPGRPDLQSHAAARRQQG